MSVYKERNQPTKNTRNSLWKEGKKVKLIKFDYKKQDKNTHEKLQKNLDDYFKKMRAA